MYASLHERGSGAHAEQTRKQWVSERTQLVLATQQLLRHEYILPNRRRSKSRRWRRW